jgi:general secretion pathway protein M
MTTNIERFLTSRPFSATLIYAAALLMLFVTFMLTLIDSIGQFTELNTAIERLDRLEKRVPPREAEALAAAASPPGLPFLVDSTRTVASAALLQRITGAVARVGGSVTSSEVDPGNAQPSDGYIKVSTTCILDQNALQQLLHDIESGMPFLFVEQLFTQADLDENKVGQLRVTLAVAGLWRAPK